MYSVGKRIPGSWGVSEVEEKLLPISTRSHKRERLLDQIQIKQRLPKQKQKKKDLLNQINLSRQSVRQSMKLLLN